MGGHPPEHSKVWGGTPLSSSGSSSRSCCEIEPLLSAPKRGQLWGRGASRCVLPVVLDGGAGVNTGTGPHATNTQLVSIQGLGHTLLILSWCHTGTGSHATDAQLGCANPSLTLNLNVQLNCWLNSYQVHRVTKAKGGYTG